MQPLVVSIPNKNMSSQLIKNLFECRLCWRITFAVFALILVVESALLVPSAQRFQQVEVERLAEQVQATVDAALVLGPGLSGNGPLGRDLATLVASANLDGLLVRNADGTEVARAGKMQRLLAGAVIPLEMPSGARPRVQRMDGDKALVTWRSMAEGSPIVTACLDTSSLNRELIAYLFRIGGLIFIIVLVVTVGTMLVLYQTLLKPMLQLRASAVAAAMTPQNAAESVLPLVKHRRHHELGDLIEAHNALLVRVTESMQRDARIAKEREYHLARHDALSGLPNRLALIEYLDRTNASGVAAPAPMALFLIELALQSGNEDKDTGDASMRDVRRLPMSSGDRWLWLGTSAEFVAQLGPALFMLVQRDPDADMHLKCASVAETILRTASNDLPHHDVMIGIVEPTPETLTAAVAMSRANFALARVRADPTTRYQFFDQASANEAVERQRTTRELERAIAEHELVIWYQPKVSLSQPSTLVGIEALVRWQHPVRGILAPGAFVPLAESTGQIEMLDRYVFAAVCRQIALWQQSGWRVPRIAVNLAARTFESPRLLQDLQRAIAATAISPRDVEIEITESAAMKSVDETAQTLAAISMFGIHTAIDDFGTGYSSLSYLRSFRIDTLKIDRSFVDGIGREPIGEAICAVIVKLGQAIGAHVVAEGVETHAQADYLRDCGCHSAQGYLYGRPLPANAFAAHWFGDAQQPAEIEAIPHLSQA
jgi:EAL domain-containing protein (putative c-di-GMP-specific phosphodiesterase class I)/GGDEF domain-containing protein